MEPLTSPTDTQKTTSSLLFCRACQAVYQQPKLLPCLHSFCRPCLVHATVNGSDGTFIICPLCSHKSQLPATGVIGVPDNSFLNRMCQEYLTEVQNHLVSRSLNHLNPRRTLELNTSSTDRSSAIPGRKYTSLSGIRSQYRGHEVSQHDEDEDTAADQSPEYSQSSDRGSPSSQSKASAVEAIRNMSRLQTKVLSLQGEALRVTYAIDQVNQSMVDWHQHKEELKKAVERRTTQFKFYLQRMEHQLIAQIDSKQTDDLFYTESDKAKLELRKTLNNILHEVGVLKSIQEFGKDAEINNLSPILLASSVGMTDVVLKKPHFEMEVPKNTIEEIVGDNFGVIRFNSEESKVFAPEVSDFSDISLGNLAQPQPGTADVPGSLGGGDIVAKGNEEPDNASTGRTPTRRSADRRSRRHNTDLGLDKEDVKEYLAQFQNARENLRARRKEILERGRQASEDASPLGDEIHRRPRSTSRNSRVQSLDRVALSVTSSRRATLPSGLALHGLTFPVTDPPEPVSSALQENSSHFQYKPSDGLKEDLSISGLTPEEQSTVGVKLPLLSSHQRILVKQTSDPRYIRESPTSPKETLGSEIIHPTHSQAFIEELRSRRFSNPSNSLFERRFSDQLNSPPHEESEDSLQHDLATSRPVRRAISSAADRKAKIDFLRENWQKRKEILIQNEGFVSPDANKVGKPQPQVQATEEGDDSKVQISETVEATGQGLSPTPTVPAADPKFESMHTIRNRVAQYRTELTKNEEKVDDKVMEKAPVSIRTQISEPFRSDLQRQKYFPSQTVVSPTYKTSNTSSLTSHTITSDNEKMSPPIQTELRNLTNQTAPKIPAHQEVSQITTNQTASQIPTNQIESHLYTGEHRDQRAHQRSTNETPPNPKYKSSILTNEVVSQITTNQITSHIPTHQIESHQYINQRELQRSTNETPSSPKYKTLIPTNEVEHQIHTNQQIPISTTVSTNIQEKPSVTVFPVQTASVTATTTTTTTTATTSETAPPPTYSRYSRYQTTKVEPIDIASLIAAMYSGNLKQEKPPETASTQSTTTQSASTTTTGINRTAESTSTTSTSSTSTRLTSTPFTYSSRYQTENKSQPTAEPSENEKQQNVLHKDEQTSKPEQESLTRPYRYTGLYSRYNSQVTNSINTTALTTTTTAIPSATSNFRPTESINTKSSTETLAAESSTLSYGSQRVALKDSVLPTQASLINTTGKSNEAPQQAQPRPQIYGLYSRYTEPVTKPVTTISTSTTTGITAAGNTSSSYSTLSSVGESTVTPSRYQTEYLQNTTAPEQVITTNPSEQIDEPTKQSQQKPSRSRMRSRFTDGVNRRHTIEIGKEAIQSALKLYSKEETTPATLDAISESPAVTHTPAYTPYHSRLSDSSSKGLESTNGTTAALPSAEPLESNEIKDTIISYKIRASGVTTKIIPKSLEVIQEKSHYDQNQTPEASVIPPAPATPPSPSLLSLSPDEIAQKVKLREIARKKKERWRHMTIH